MNTLIQNGKFLSENLEDGTTILVNQETGIVHILNMTCAVIYSNCHGNSVEEVLDIYINQFRELENDLNILTRDFNEIIQDMLEKEIILTE